MKDNNESIDTKENKHRKLAAINPPTKLPSARPTAAPTTTNPSPNPTFPPTELAVF